LAQDSFSTQDLVEHIVDTLSSVEDGQDVSARSRRECPFSRTSAFSHLIDRSATYRCRSLSCLECLAQQFHLPVTEVNDGQHSICAGRIKSVMVMSPHTDGRTANVDNDAHHRSVLTGLKVSRVRKRASSARRPSRSSQPSTHRIEHLRGSEKACALSAQR
jgi:hypothetical protein